MSYASHVQIHRGKIKGGYERPCEAEKKLTAKMLQQEQGHYSAPGGAVVQTMQHGTQYRTDRRWHRQA